MAIVRSFAYLITPYSRQLYGVTFLFTHSFPSKQRRVWMGTIRKNNSTDLVQMDDEQLSQLLGFDVTDSSALEKAIFTSINEGNRVAILNIFQNYPSSTSILQILLTTTYPNKDHFYTHDPEVIRDADELLGER